MSDRDVKRWLEDDIPTALRQVLSSSGQDEVEPARAEQLKARVAAMVAAGAGAAAASAAGSAHAVGQTSLAAGATTGTKAVTLAKSLSVGKVLVTSSVLAATALSTATLPDWPSAAKRERAASHERFESPARGGQGVHAAQARAPNMEDAMDGPRVEDEVLAGGDEVLEAASEVAPSQEETEVVEGAALPVSGRERKAAERRGVRLAEGKTEDEDEDAHVHAHGYGDVHGQGYDHARGQGYDHARGQGSPVQESVGTRRAGVEPHEGKVSSEELAEPAPLPTALEQEAALIAAMRAASGSDDRRVLALAQKHRADFEQGRLRPERALLTLEAQLRLGMRREACASAVELARNPTATAYQRRAQEVLRALSECEGLADIAGVELNEGSSDHEKEHAP